MPLSVTDSSACIWVEVIQKIFFEHTGGISKNINPRFFVCTILVSQCTHMSGTTQLFLALKMSGKKIIFHVTHVWSCKHHNIWIYVHICDMFMH